MRKSIALVLVFCFLSGYCMAVDNLYHRFSEKSEIKVYLKDVKNESDAKEVDIKIFKKIFKEELGQRIAMNFVSVETQDEADVAVSATIEKYAFTEKALPNFLSLYALAADSTAPKSQADLVVSYVVRDARSDRIIAKKNNFTIAERRPIDDMKGENAFKFACEKSINRFIFRMFRQQERNRL